METYSRLPIKIVRGNGCRVWDDTGREYLDMVSGIAVCNLGHAHPKVVDALTEQAKELFHCSNLYQIPLQEELAGMIAQHSFDSRAFFCNSGAEANEAAIKLSRRYCNTMGKRGAHIITFEGSFHGRTLATVAATAQGKFRKGFDPIPEGFIAVPYGDIEALEAAIDDRVGALMLEPIQGEGGINLPPKGYLKQVRQLCSRHAILLILDEIQTGMGRTGKLFCYMHEDMEPDIMTLAKALGNGFPVGAMVAKPYVAEAFIPGSHASTFGGNPLAMASSIATLKVMLEEKIPERTGEMGLYLMDGLMQLKTSHAGIKDVRGRGLMAGIEFDTDISSFNADGLDKGILLNVIQSRILRIAPALVITKQEIDEALAAIDTLLTEKGL
ncbi:MAG: aspartate aminotransferase family protein [Deltaproteobacteria bacterium]|nr:aspartate aminotransferase family protein [Deltaproteobacteria bacterium]